jgi:HEAT repeat protein
MTTGKRNFIKLAVIILTTVLLSSQIYAFNTLGNNITKTLENEIPEAAIKNLANGIATGNLGVKRCCIYLAGYYEIKELVHPLTEQLAKETDTNTKLLIVLALYKIGNPEAQKAIRELANKDVNSSVKDLGKAVINNFNLYSSFINN